MEISIFIKCLIFRLLSILAIQTYFVADEYWQSLEIAHAVTFGYGYYTWEYTEEIRSFAYPAVFTVLYKALKLFRADYSLLVIYVPKLFQAFLSALTDYNFIKLCYSFNLPKRDIWLSLYFDWFGFFCGSRTIINTFEANFITFGLGVFPWHTLSLPFKEPVSRYFGLLVFFICWARPTALLIWGPFLLAWVINSKHVSIITVIKDLMFPFCVTILSCLALDSFFYGHLTFTPFNFLNFNIFKGIASFYGSHPFHWYFSQGLPVALGLFIVPLCSQTYCTIKTFFSGGDRISFIHNVNMLLLPSIFSSFCLLSFIKHKEFRFLLPLTPMMKIIFIQGIAPFRRWKYNKLVLIIVVLGFLIPSLLFGQFHQKGTLSVMKVIEEEAMKKPENTSVLILTPCHATPLYSHLHVNVPVRFITCEPPITSRHLDESDLFFANPFNWLHNYFQENSHKLPSHVVMFDNLIIYLNDFLTNHNYTHSHTLFHTIFPEGRISKNIVVYEFKLYH